MARAGAGAAAGLAVSVAWEKAERETSEVIRENEIVLSIADGFGE
jgi:hypothetical protein